MRINHNIASLNTYRQLTMNNGSSAKNIERLSSGLRINRAGDDAAGLAISEKMRGQIRGLEMATRNAQDGISMIQTAEGALNETHSILQRMRELAVQGSNDTQTDKDRAELQKEISQLKDEIDRISNTTEFNTKKLLNGDLQSAKVAQGDVLQSADVKAAIVSSMTGNPVEGFAWGGGNIKVTLSGGATATVNIAAGNYTASGFAAALDSALSGAGTSFQGGRVAVTANASGKIIIDTSGVSINSISGLSSVGIAEGTSGNAGVEISGTTAFGKFTIGSGNDEFNVTTSNGTVIKLQLTSGQYADEAALVAEINAQLAAHAASGTAGLTASVSGNNIKFSASGSFTISAEGSDKTLAKLGVAAGTISDKAVLANLQDNNGDLLGIKSGDTIKINAKVNGTAVAELTLNVGTATTIEDLTSKIASGLGLSGSQVSFVNGKIQITGKSGEDNDIQDLKLSIAGNDKFNNHFSNFAEIQDAQDAGTNNALSFQIGANQDQTMRVDISEMSVGSLSLSSVDISTEQGAQNSITVINNALEKVSAERAKLGAFQNRLEHTINNLGTSAENLTASESRIRDVDMAKEMMEFTKNNILTQAAQSMLAQANQQPQGVLQLLR
ncbi:flagellin [Paenibacillus thermotolerans]|uniref:flagellin N-terminal helical domain-containing protein n=1 Tax=Paenibacillus thermotolerans TaxID=3027807 RepID=UPI002368272B|nr:MULTISPECIES: flagellin [unclassified Paenibacillus]